MCLFVCLCPCVRVSVCPCVRVSVCPLSTVQVLVHTGLAYKYELEYLCAFVSCLLILVLKMRIELLCACNINISLRFTDRRARSESRLCAMDNFGPLEVL